MRVTEVKQKDLHQDLIDDSEVVRTAIQKAQDSVVDEKYSAGYFVITWEGKDNINTLFSSGACFLSDPG
jgi:hypothetical protein